MESSEIEKFIKLLAQKKHGNPIEIANEIGSNISNKELDALVELLYSQNIIFHPHKQSRSSSLPEYDKIIITDKGLAS